MYTTRTNIFTCRTLIYSFVEGTGADTTMYKMRAFFRLPLAFGVPIFNKKSHRTPDVETFKIWPKFESFHSSCPMRLSVEN